MKSERGFQNIGKFQTEILYHADKEKSGPYREYIALGSTTVNAGWNVLGLFGGSKVIKGMSNILKYAKGRNPKPVEKPPVEPFKGGQNGWTTNYRN